MLLLRKADVIPDSIPPIVFLATLYCLEVIKLFLLFSLVSWLPREIEWPGFDLCYIKGVCDHNEFSIAD